MGYNIIGKIMLLNAFLTTKKDIRLLKTRVRLNSEGAKKETHLVFNLVSQEILETYKKII